MRTLFFFFGQEHREEIDKLEELWDALHDLAEMAKRYGIGDIFQDNGAKVLQQLVLLNFDQLPGREGNDAVSESGIEWEMKSINLETSAVGFSTNHHTTYDIIDKYSLSTQDDYRTYYLIWQVFIYIFLSFLYIFALMGRKISPIDHIFIYTIFPVSLY